MFFGMTNTCMCEVCLITLKIYHNARDNLLVWKVRHYHVLTSYVDNKVYIWPSKGDAV